MEKESAILFLSKVH